MAATNESITFAKLSPNGVIHPMVETTGEPVIIDLDRDIIQTRKVMKLNMNEEGFMYIGGRPIFFKLKNDRCFFGHFAPQRAKIPYKVTIRLYNDRKFRVGEDMRCDGYKFEITQRYEERNLVGENLTHDICGTEVPIYWRDWTFARIHVEMDIVPNERKLENNMVWETDAYIDCDGKHRIAVNAEFLSNISTVFTARWKEAREMGVNVISINMPLMDVIEYLLVISPFNKLIRHPQTLRAAYLLTLSFDNVMLHASIQQSLNKKHPLIASKWVHEAKLKIRRANQYEEAVREYGLDAVQQEIAKLMAIQKRNRRTLEMAPDLPRNFWRRITSALCSSFSLC